MNVLFGRIMLPFIKGSSYFITFFYVIGYLCNWLSQKSPREERVALLYVFKSMGTQFNGLKFILWLVLLGTLLACQSSNPSQTPVPSPPQTVRPQPTSSVSLTPTELKYVLFARFGETFYCDPDFYPIAHRDEMELALERFPDIQKETEKFQAMLRHLNLTSVTTFNDDQKLMVYREYKRLNSILLEANGGQFNFSLTISENKNEEGKGKVVEGSISTSGAITVTKEEQTFLTCPICLSEGTIIDTPDGPIPVEMLHDGASIWTVDRDGNRVAAKILQSSRTPVPAGHLVVSVVLADGRQLYASPGHPTADGRVLGDIGVGDELDGARVMSADLIDYTYEYTYDILPSGGAGHYWANGILLGSTLK